jgi:hypothetical protein
MQPKSRPLCKEIFCKATSFAADNLHAPTASIASFKALNIENLTRHEFFVKKFEHALLQAVQSNRLRRFGRWHEFFWKLFLLSVRCPNQFFCPNRPAISDALAACSVDAVGFHRYGAASAPPR